MDVPVESSDHNQRQEQPKDRPNLHKQQQQQSPDTLDIAAENGGEKPAESDWIISIDEKLKEARQDNVAHAWDKVSIYRIPQHLKDGQEKAYEPRILSLGPYHHGKEHLREMERHKWRCLHRMLDRTQHDIRRYLLCMKTLEERARACYEGAIPLTSKEFVEMMVLDGCFVIELLRGRAAGLEKLGYPKKDPLFSLRIYPIIRKDMIMLENQIPLFILDRLLGLQLGRPDASLYSIVPQFFDLLGPTVELPANSGDPLSDLGYLHCLDVLRKSLLSRGPEPTQIEYSEASSGYSMKLNPGPEGAQLKPIHCVTELRKAGIHFSKKNTDRFWDMSFENGTFLIPRLFIEDDTRSFFLNIIAFEQSHSGCPNEITSYVIFMDSLINSPQDVAELHYKGIIEHCLGSDAEVADLFNQLSKEVVFDIERSYLAELSVEVNRYYNRRWNTWRALLKHKYFSNPWSIISIVAAFVLLLLTFTQTFYSVYGDYRPRS